MYCFLAKATLFWLNINDIFKANFQFSSVREYGEFLYIKYLLLTVPAENRIFCVLNIEYSVNWMTSSAVIDYTH